MPRRSTTDYASAARRYQVSERTVRRWHAAGADLSNPESVANVILRQNRPSIKAMRNLETLLP